MSDTMAPWVPPNPPPMAEHFREAAQGQQREVSTVTEQSQGQGDSGLQQMLEEQRETPKLEMHHRPDDPELVKKVHTKVETEREAFINKLSQRRDDDFGPRR